MGIVTPDDGSEDISGLGQLEGWVPLHEELAGAGVDAELAARRKETRSNGRRMPEARVSPQDPAKKIAFGILAMHPSWERASDGVLARAATAVLELEKAKNDGDESAEEAATHELAVLRDLVEKANVLDKSGTPQLIRSGDSKGGGAPLVLTGIEFLDVGAELARREKQICGSNAEAHAIKRSTRPHPWRECSEELVGAVQDAIRRLDEHAASGDLKEAAAAVRDLQSLKGIATRANEDQRAIGGVRSPLMESVGISESVSLPEEPEWSVVGQVRRLPEGPLEHLETWSLLEFARRLERGAPYRWIGERLESEEESGGSEVMRALCFEDPWFRCSDIHLKLVADTASRLATSSMHGTPGEQARLHEQLLKMSEVAIRATRLEDELLPARASRPERLIQLHRDLRSLQRAAECQEDAGPANETPVLTEATVDSRANMYFLASVGARLAYIEDIASCAPRTAHHALSRLLQEPDACEVIAAIGALNESQAQPFLDLNLLCWVLADELARLGTLHRAPETVRHALHWLDGPHPLLQLTTSQAGILKARIKEHGGDAEGMRQTSHFARFMSTVRKDHLREECLFRAALAERIGRCRQLAGDHATLAPWGEASDEGHEAIRRQCDELEKAVETLEKWGALRQATARQALSSISSIKATYPTAESDPVAAQILLKFKNTVLHRLRDAYAWDADELRRDIAGLRDLLAKGEALRDRSRERNESTSVPHVSKASGSTTEPLRSKPRAKNQRERGRRPEPSSSASMSSSTALTSTTTDLPKPDDDKRTVAKVDESIQPRKMKVKTRPPFASTPAFGSSGASSSSSLSTRATPSARTRLSGALKTYRQGINYFREQGFKITVGGSHWNLHDPSGGGLTLVLKGKQDQKLSEADKRRLDRFERERQEKMNEPPGS